MIRLFIVLLSISLVHTSLASGLIDFKEEKARVKKRRQAFYEFVRKKKRDRARIEEFAEEHSRKRVEQQRAYDKIREKFKKSRKTKESQFAAEKRHLAQLKKRQSYREKKRQMYVKYRKQLESIRKNQGVPDNQDVGLESVVE